MSIINNFEEELGHCTGVKINDRFTKTKIERIILTLIRRGFTEKEAIDIAVDIWSLAFFLMDS